MAQNPFTLAFGKEPINYIDRESQNNEIIESFEAEHPTHQVFMVTGVRGTGKTVTDSLVGKPTM